MENIIQQHLRCADIQHRKVPRLFFIFSFDTILFENSVLHLAGFRTLWFGKRPQLNSMKAGWLCKCMFADLKTQERVLGVHILIVAIWKGKQNLNLNKNVCNL